MRANGPKVTVIGAGSFFFGRPVIWNMVSSPILREGTLALVDTDESVLKTMMSIARRAIDETGAPLRLEGSTERTDVLPDSDFVVLTFSKRNAHYRGIDCEISERHGIRMCSGDTIGPGGIFRALREIPVALEIARDVEALAPAAWILNFVNPATVLGIALDRFAPNVRSFAICDGPHEPWNRMKLLKRLGIVSQDAVSMPVEIEQHLVMDIVGVNHFTWVSRFEYQGRDLLPEWKALLEQDARAEREKFTGSEGGTDNNAYSKAKYNAAYALDLFSVFGAYPDRIGHTKEYVPYYQGLGVAANEPEPITIFDAEERQAKMDAFWKENEAYASGATPISHFMEHGKPDHATDIIESMWGDLGKRFIVNTRNNGAVPNIQDDAILELRSDLDMGSVNPRPSGPMPLGIRGLTQQVLDTHELTAAAGATYDRELLLRALATDPIVNNLSDARHVMNDLLQAEREILRPEWYA